MMLAIPFSRFAAFAAGEELPNVRACRVRFRCNRGDCRYLDCVARVMTAPDPLAKYEQRSIRSRSRGCPICGSSDANVANVVVVLRRLQPSGRRDKVLATKSRSLCGTCAARLFDEFDSALSAETETM